MNIVIFEYSDTQTAAAQGESYSSNPGYSIWIAEHGDTEMYYLGFVNDDNLLKSLDYYYRQPDVSDVYLVNKDEDGNKKAVRYVPDSERKAEKMNPPLSPLSPLSPLPPLSLPFPNLPSDAPSNSSHYAPGNAHSTLGHNKYCPTRANSKNMCMCLLIEEIWQEAYQEGYDDAIEEFYMWD